MTNLEEARLKIELERLFKHHIDELKKGFVPRSEFEPMAAMVRKHDKVYSGAVKLLIYIGILTTITFFTGAQNKGAIAWIEKLIRFVNGG